MSLFWTIIFLSFTFSTNNLSQAKHQKKLTSAAVVGTVKCNTCSHQDIPKATHYIQGASVAVECKDTTSRPSFRHEVKTNKHGEFKIQLPFSVSKHAKKITGCTVRLISSNQPFCSVATTPTSSPLHLKSRKQGTHIFSPGFLTFKPQVCDQKPTIKKLQMLSPNPPNILRPNPNFQPPPSIIPPIFPTPPPPSIFSPFFHSPPPPPLSNFPPIPGLIQSPPPQSQPIHIPPFPFQPTPGFPGVPPAEVSP